MKTDAEFRAERVAGGSKGGLKCTRVGCSCCRAPSCEQTATTTVQVSYTYGPQFTSTMCSGCAVVCASTTRPKGRTVTVL